MADNNIQNIRIKHKRDTSANWTSKNPVLLNGELIIVTTDSGETRFKIGDGTKTYTQLPFTDELLYNALSTKVEKVEGKGLSTNDFTDAEKAKLAELNGEQEYRINAIASYENGNISNISKDKTFAEMLEAYEAGKHLVVYLTHEEIEMPVSFALTVASNEYMLFTMPLVEDGVVSMLMIGADESVQEMANDIIHPLTFTGAVEAMFNGTGSVTVEIPKELPDGAEAHQMLVTDAEGKAKWIARPMREPEGSVTEILPECKPVVNVDEGSGDISAMILEPLFTEDIIDGETYTVYWNGTPYKTTAALVEEDGEQLWILGDFGLLSGGVSTGEPFVIAYVTPETGAMYGFYAQIMPIDGSTDITLKIERGSITYHPLGLEYLPEYMYGYIGERAVCLPEMTVSIDAQENGAVFAQSFTNNLVVGEKYVVKWNGVSYTATAKEGENGAVYLGNLGLVSGSYEDTGEVFYICQTFDEYSLSQGIHGIVYIDSPDITVAQEVTFSVTEADREVRKVPKEFLPDGIIVAKPITITVDSNLNITTDTPYETAFALSERELQSALRIVFETGFNDFTASVNNVNKIVVDGASAIDIHCLVSYEVGENNRPPRMWQILWSDVGVLLGTFLPQLPHMNIPLTSDPVLYYNHGNEEWKPNYNHTVTDTGEGWFAKDVYVGGTSATDGEKLVKESELPKRILLEENEDGSQLHTHSRIGDIFGNETDFTADQVLMWVITCGIILLVAQNNALYDYDSYAVAATQTNDDSVIKQVYFKQINGDKWVVMNGNAEFRYVDVEWPDYWETHVSERAVNVRSAMDDAGWDKSAFLYYTDAHWTQGSKMSPKILEYLSKNTAINKTIFGGDILSDETDTSYLHKWRNALRNVPNHHSVPGNHDDGNTTENLFSDEAVYSYLLADEATPDVVRGDGLYYYIDDASERTRYLYLDTATSDSEIYYNTKQQEWLKQALLTVPEEWHVVVAAHIWRDVDYSVTPPVDNGFSLSGKWCLDLFDAFNSRTGEFGACSGQVEFCVGGHTHVDGDFTSDGGIPVIITETDSAIVRSGLGFTQDTITEASVSAIVANYAARKVDVIRIGRGSSRTVTLPAAHLEGATGYTNVLKDANIGWQDNTRYSSTNGVDQSADGWDITGYIAAVPYDVIRLKNVTWKYATYEENSGRGGITMFGSDKAYIAKADSIDASVVADFNVVLDDDGNIVQFTVPNWNEGITYIRICCQDINESSIITVNEEIVNVEAEVEVATTAYVDAAIQAYIDEAILGGAW